MFTELLKSSVYPFLTPTANVERQRTTTQLVAAVARHSAGQIAPVIGAIVPGILAAVQKDDDELRESSLQVWTDLWLSEAQRWLNGFTGTGSPCS